MLGHDCVQACFLSSSYVLLVNASSIPPHMFVLAFLRVCDITHPHSLRSVYLLKLVQLHMWLRGWELVAISLECLQNFICILGTWQINLDEVKCFLSSSSLSGSSHSPTISYCFCFAISHFLISLISRKKEEEEKSFMKRLIPACNKSLMSQKGQDGLLGGFQKV